MDFAKKGSVRGCRQEPARASQSRFWAATGYAVVGPSSFNGILARLPRQQVSSVAASCSPSISYRKWATRSLHRVYSQVHCGVFVFKHVGSKYRRRAQQETKWRCHESSFISLKYGQTFDGRLANGRRIWPFGGRRSVQEARLLPYINVRLRRTASPQHSTFGVLRASLVSRRLASRGIEAHPIHVE